MTDRIRRRRAMVRVGLLDFLATASWRLQRYTTMREKLEDLIEDARADVRIVHHAVDQFNLDAGLGRADH